MNETISARKIVTNAYFSMLCVLGVFFLLPRYGGIAVMVGCASILSVYVAVVPEQFRSRSGSLVAAIWLVAAMWLAAAAIAAMVLTGAIENS